MFNLPINMTDSGVNVSAVNNSRIYSRSDVEPRVAQWDGPGAINAQTSGRHSFERKTRTYGVVRRGFVSPCTAWSRGYLVVRRLATRLTTAFVPLLRWPAGLAEQKCVLITPTFLIVPCDPDPCLSENGRTPTVSFRVLISFLPAKYLRCQRPFAVLLW